MYKCSIISTSGLSIVWCNIIIDILILYQSAVLSHGKDYVIFPNLFSSVMLVGINDLRARLVCKDSTLYLLPNGSTSYSWNRGCSLSQQIACITKKHKWQSVPVCRCSTSPCTCHRWIDRSECLQWWPSGGPWQLLWSNSFSFPSAHHWPFPTETQECQLWYL